MNAFATLAPVCLKTSEGDSATVSLYGAQVLSWKAMNGQEQLFLSPKAQLDAKGAIRGGIPVCFPQFNQRVLNDRALAKHGFARVATWRLVEQCENRVSLILEARDLTEETIAAWPFSFYARVQVTLGVRSLKVTFSVQNTDAQAWPFAARKPDIHFA